MQLQGATAVSRGAVAASVRATESQLALVNGGVGVVFAPAGRLQVVLALTVSPARRITAIDVIADPGRLRRLRLALLPD
jgi:RNA polymerase sigma-70 factor (ECF subfamily)